MRSSYVTLAKLCKPVELTKNKNKFIGIWHWEPWRRFQLVYTVLILMISNGKRYLHYHYNVSLTLNSQNYNLKLYTAHMCLTVLLVTLIMLSKKYVYTVMLKTVLCIVLLNVNWPNLFGMNSWFGSIIFMEQTGPYPQKKLFWGYLILKRLH